MKIDFEHLNIRCACGGKTSSTTTRWKGIDVRAWKCSRCGEEYFHPADAQKALELVRAQRKHELCVRVREVGKSMTVTLPRPLVERLGIRRGDRMEWTVRSIHERKLEVAPHTRAREPSPPG